MITILRWLLRLLYGFRSYNDRVVNTPGPVLLLPNHISWWDWLFIGVCLDEDWRFVTSSTAAETSWLHKKIMVNRRTFPVDINSPYAVKHMAEYLHKGGRLVLFPEGRISSTGSLMKLFDGTGFLISKTGAKVITAHIRGAERLPFSRNPNLKRWFPKVSTHFSDILAAPHRPHTTAAHERARLTEWLRDRMLEQQFTVEMEFGSKSVPEAFVAAARLEPGRTILQDATMTGLTYRRMLVGATLLAQQWTEKFGRVSEPIGVLLPNTNTAPVVMLSLWEAGKVPAVLNYTTGAATMLSCCKVSGVKRVVTSRTFVIRAKLDIQPLADAGVELVYLEDVRQRISGAGKLRTLVTQGISPGLRTRPGPTDTALVLFTSGSEGEPKAVELSHRNVLANIRQMVSVIDLVERDRFFTALPIFHSFGMTVGLWLPLVRNVFVFLYLSPLHYRVVPSAVYNLNSTVLFGTNTFLSGYARKAHPYDFRSVRYVFAGAEKLQESTELLWARKFGIRILEGYGATECSPCVAVNVPLHPQFGSAGRLLPGIDYKLEQVEGIGDHSPNTGRLLVRGPNIMKGYLNAQPNARFQELGGWYDTGDIVRVDDHRCVYILGRLKRFAKISGEMVSLGSVEEALTRALASRGAKFQIAVIARKDEHKGEKLVAVSNDAQLKLDETREVIRSAGLSNLAAPRELKYLKELPILGTGKVDYRTLEKLI